MVALALGTHPLQRYVRMGDEPDETELNPCKGYHTNIINFKRGFII
jgi:hypothetical protein